MITVGTSFLGRERVSGVQHRHDIPLSPKPLADHLLADPPQLVRALLARREVDPGQRQNLVVVQERPGPVCCVSAVLSLHSRTAAPTSDNRIQQCPQNRRAPLRQRLGRLLQKQWQILGRLHVVRTSWQKRVACRPTFFLILQPRGDQLRRDVCLQIQFGVWRLSEGPVKCRCRRTHCPD